MKKKVIIIVIIISIILIANYFYNKKNSLYVLECNYNSKYQDYDEKLTFSYIDNVLIKFVREEEVRSDNIDEAAKPYEEMKESAPNYSFFSYDVKKGAKAVYVTTTIYPFHSQDFYNDYMVEKDLDFDDDMDDVEKELNIQNYTCKRYLSR